MEITLNKKSNTEGVIKIKLAESDYQPHVEEKVKEYSRKATSKVSARERCLLGLSRECSVNSLLADEINNVLSTQPSGYIKDNNLKNTG